MRSDQTIQIAYKSYRDRHPDRNNVYFYLNDVILFDGTIKELGINNGDIIIAK